MMTQNRIKTVLTLAVAAMAVVLGATTARAGTISYVPISGDADSGISTDKTYTHAIDFGNQPAGGGVATVNGVIFANGSAGSFPAIGGSSQTIGTGSSTIPDNHNGDAAADAYLTAGGMRELVYDMIYNDTTAVITLTGLTSAQPYQFRLYHRSWGGTRPQDIGFDTDGVGTDITGAEDTAVFFEDDATQPDPGFATATQVYALTYDYTLSSGVTTLTVYVNNTGTGTYHLYGLTNEETGPADPMNPSPYDGANVQPANPLTLRWTNLDPNTVPRTPVFVDVWFGTDPEALAQVPGVSGVADVNSVEVDASAVGVYYWRVDSYMEGSSTGAPDVVGTVWTFSTDFPPASVEILTPDMITWSGRGVDLLGTFDDDSDPLDQTIAWSADPDAGVSFTDETALDPTVTITKVPGFVPFVLNGGFEDEVLAEGEYVYSLGDFWRDGYYEGSRWYDDDYYAGVEDPNAPYGGIVPEGENAAFQYSYAGYDMGLRQILASTLAADTHYELSVMVGNPDAVASNDYRVELLAGGVVLNSTTGASPAPDTWTATPVTVTYDSPSSVDLGQALEIRLVLVDDGSMDQLLNFDDVKLLVDGESSTYDTAPLTVTVTFGVNDVINPAAVTDTMTIDVYDTPCRAAIGKDPEALDPADFDKNCIVNLADLAIFLDEYLTCTTPNVFGCVDYR